MFCPKCGGGTFISDEELVKILEDSRPLKAVIKIIYVCRACGDKFGRLIHEHLENRKRDETGVSSQPSSVQPKPVGLDTAAEGLRFF